MENVVEQTFCGAVLEGVKIAIPVVGAVLVWALQTLAQRAWNEYERRREVYETIVREIESLFTSGDPGRRPEYLRAVRVAYLVGSDEVVRAANALSESTASGVSDEDRSRAFSDFIYAMRCDLRRRRLFPGGSTHLAAPDFPMHTASR